MKEQKNHKNIFKLKLRFNDLYSNVEDVFKTYPISLISVILAFTFAAGFDNDFCECVALFLGFFSIGSLFNEQFFKNKKILFLIAFVINGLISFSLMMYMKEKIIWLFGLNDEWKQLIIISFGACLLVTELMLSLYSMYKKSEKSFEEYCLSIFTELFKTYIIYGAFAIGFLFLFLLFEFLICDTNGLYARVEVALLGVVLAPLTLKAVSKLKAETTKFAKVMILYVLMPLYILAYAVIYIYIIKVVFSFELPSNELYYIIAFLFSIGMPIWTMAQFFEKSIIGKIGKFMPFGFFPLFILQSICIGIRVKECGITVARYWALMLLLFELIYLLLYIIKFIKKNELVSLTFIVVPVLVLVGTLMPGINGFAMTVWSQGGRLETYIDDYNDISEENKGKAYSCYKVIDECLAYGPDYLENNYSSKEIKIIKNWSDCTDENKIIERYYLNNNNQNDFNVSNYSELHYFVDARMSADDGESLDLSSVLLENDDFLYYCDFTDFIKEAEKVYDENDFAKTEQFLRDNPIRTKDAKIYVRYLSFEKLDDRYIYYDIDTVVLVK